uniref:Uncharacterized protein n=1 Tax=Opuntia streptacantha TaxID=393608 RepID=A0A7C9AEB6_OPUST
MNGGPSGFNNAPVTRAIIIACALFTIFFGMQGRSKMLGLSFQVDLVLHRGEGMCWAIYLLMLDDQWRETTIPHLLALWNHQRTPLQPWSQWDLTGTQQGRH